MTLDELIAKMEARIYGGYGEHEPYGRGLDQGFRAAIVMVEEYAVGAPARAPMGGVDDNTLDALIRYELCNNGNLRQSENIDLCVGGIIEAIRPYLTTPRLSDDEAVVVEELKPCPYTSFPSDRNKGVNFMLKKYGAYSDFILFEDGVANRCFRFSNSALREAESQGGAG